MPNIRGPVRLSAGRCFQSIYDFALLWRRTRLKAWRASRLVFPMKPGMVGAPPKGAKGLIGLDTVILSIPGQSNYMLRHFPFKKAVTCPKVDANFASYFWILNRLCEPKLGV